MGRSCCSKKPVCNRPEMKERCCEKKERCCEKKERCEKDKCLTAQELYCILERFQNRIPPFPCPFPPRPLPPSGQVIQIPAGQLVTFDDDINLYTFTVCVPIPNLERNLAIFKIGNSRYYTALATLADVALDGCSGATYNIVFTQAIGDALRLAGYLTGTSPNFTTTANGTLTIFQANQIADVLANYSA